ncbi:MAG: glycogen/starch synthase [Bacteroidales bacterium]|nr:glycogen/starch synthase [Bacteroidales bacterium]MBO7256397.1 glycogen/starch synthase [Bacteroidales bacterium]MBO7283936.1 glycogen/starch synthase [Bacteroidales bacterium]MBO7323131.1 glycogen/starch synthase [Bacteroidales bacterium]MBQ5881754.1 glycogen/starch synthase [Bacteroidales bacterium]
MKETKRVLFVNSEILPYLPETKFSAIGRYLPQGIQERGKEIRSFMPRYGCINERRNQLHEVIRLSGMNVVINDIDRPLVIKVASISAARMQVYFIDNDDYFHRKQIFENEEGQFFEDNDERAIFFARGILETVKKLRWKPDIIHCNGWISHLVPLFLKKAYKNDPIFTDAKVVVSLYDEYINETFDPEMKGKISMPGIKPKDMELLNEPNGINLAKLALQYSDGLIKGVESINPEVEEFAKAQGLPILEYVEQVQPSGEYIDRYNEFYDKILDEVR